MADLAPSPVTLLEAFMGVTRWTACIATTCSVCGKPVAIGDQVAGRTPDKRPDALLAHRSCDRLWYQSLRNKRHQRRYGQHREPIVDSRQAELFGGKGCR